MNRRLLAARLREMLMRRWGVPYSRHGVSTLILRAFNKGELTTLVDVGASDGEFAISIDRHYHLKRALLVEPQPDRAAQLRRSFPSSRFVIAQSAASSESGESKMDILNWDYSSSLLGVDRSRLAVTAKVDLSVRETITVPIARLDDLCDTAGFCEVDLLKLDVQGAELLVLRGAEKVLTRARFVLAEVSFNSYYFGGATFDQVLSHLQLKGFRLVGLTEGFRDSEGELVEGDALFAR